MNTKAINWFEIPVTDISRAIEFYQNIFSIKFTTMEMGEANLAMFPMEFQPSGALVQGDGYAPSKEGCIVYLNAEGKMEEILNNIANVKCEIIMPKTAIGEFGFIGKFIDSEGNLIALHSSI